MCEASALFLRSSSQSRSLLPWLHPPPPAKRANQCMCDRPSSTTATCITASTNTASHSMLWLMAVALCHDACSRICNNNTHSHSSLPVEEHSLSSSLGPPADIIVHSITFHIAIQHFKTLIWGFMRPIIVLYSQLDQDSSTLIITRPMLTT